MWCQQLHRFTPGAKPSTPLPTKATHQTRLDESLAGKGKLAHTPPQQSQPSQHLHQVGGLDGSDTQRLSS